MECFDAMIDGMFDRMFDGMFDRIDGSANPIRHVLARSRSVTGRFGKSLEHGRLL